MLLGSDKIEYCSAGICSSDLDSEKDKIRMALEKSKFRFLKTLVITFSAILLWGAATGQAEAQENWVQLSPQHAPRGRDDAAMAFDSARGVVVMFGGDNAGSATWVWDGRDWKDLGIGGPAPRREAAMAFDSKRGVIVMFGGYDYVIHSYVTWEFDGEAWNLAGLAEEDSPTGRSDHAMVFDEDLGLCIMFGGDGVDGSTWAYSGTEWYSVNEEADGPGARWGHAMVYDSDRKVIVLFGGYGDGLLADTWEWDGSEWAEVTPESGNPPAMRDHVMVYDSSRKKTVLFGGREGSPEGLDRTWEWDGAQWTEVNTPLRPSPRHEAAAAYDSIRKKMVLFGGSRGELEDDRYSSETWVFPNGGPVITHEPVLGAFPGRDLEISATVIDYDEDEVTARIFYRTAGDGGFSSVAMSQRSETEFVGTIPGEDVFEDGLEYYIRAADPQGSNKFGYSGDPEAPYAVSVAETGSLHVFIAPKNARKQGAEWRVEGDDAWHISRDTMEGLEPGEHIVHFRTLDGWIKPEPLTVTIIHGRVTDVYVEYRRP